MRNEFEQYGSQAFQPSPLHQPGEVFYSQHAPGPSNELEGASVPSSSGGTGYANTTASASRSSSSSEGHPLGSPQEEADALLGAALAGSDVAPALGAGMEAGSASSGSEEEEASAGDEGDLAGALEWLRGGSGAAAGDGSAAAAGAGVVRQQWTWAAAGWLSENPLVSLGRHFPTLSSGHCLLSKQFRSIAVGWWAASYSQRRWDRHTSANAKEPVPNGSYEQQDLHIHKPSMQT